MSGPYRDENGALVARCAALEGALSDALQERERALAAARELATQMSTLRRRRLGRAERQRATRRAAVRGVIYGLLVGSVLGIGSMCVATAPRASTTRASHPSRSWFAAARPHCNAVEVAGYVGRSPPPRTHGGSAYLATCYTLAGRVSEAERILMALPTQERERAAELIFAVVHPTADGGDELATMAAMRMITRHSPRNHMAAYHSKMSPFGEAPSTCPAR